MFGVRKLSFKFEEVEIVVVGGGHAAIEAALVSSRMGKKTILITMSLNTIGSMPCNPSIGGTGKGQLVKELDALGGQMGKVADKTTIQSRILNLKKGPAVHSLRVQIDRSAYHIEMKNILENELNLLILQDEVVEIKVENDEVKSVITALNLEIKTKVIILACGTFLDSKIHIGKNSFKSGPDGVFSSKKLALNLVKLGIKLRRFKTGTSARVRKSSIDFTKLKIQKGDENVLGFSCDSETILQNQVNCFIAATNEQTHEVILTNLKKSALYGGEITGIGPRYCPSIEDKVVRFKEKKSHQFFIEPVGLNTGEMYLQGLSTSLPFDVQLKFLKTIEGLQHVEIIRSAYAIEYSCCNPLDLFPTLEYKNIHGLFGAGQFNGTSGYEEAAVQGFVAGVNAALKVSKKEPMVFSRSSSLIGTLIDDLTTKGCNEPYRMMTARSEYRLTLRQDNADTRLTKIGHDLGLVNDEQFEQFCKKQRQIENEKKRIFNVTIKPSAKLNKLLEKSKATKVDCPINFVSCLKRPNVTYKMLIEFDKSKNKVELTQNQIMQIEIEVKYAGYIAKQNKRKQLEKKMENVELSSKIDYFKKASIGNLWSKPYRHFSALCLVKKE